MDHIYLVIGGPRYEGPEIRSIYGAYTTRREAEQCYNFFKDTCGSIYFLRVPVDQRPHPSFEELDISLFSESPPEWGFTIEVGHDYEAIYFVIYEGKDDTLVLHKVCSSEKDARSVRTKLQPNDQSAWGEFRIRRYLIRDLALWSLTEDIIDKDIQPMTFDLGNSPFFYRGYV